MLESLRNPQTKPVWTAACRLTAILAAAVLLCLAPVRADAGGVLAIDFEDIGYIDENCDGTRVRTEHTFDWYIQDDNGNIWYVGELSREYEGDCAEYAGDPSEADRLVRPECYVGSWEAGKGPAGGLIAQAGIVVPSDFPTGAGGPPLTAGTYYMQELAEEAMDVAKVVKVDAKVKVKTDDGTTVFQGCRGRRNIPLCPPAPWSRKTIAPMTAASC